MPPSLAIPAAAVRGAHEVPPGAVEALLQISAEPLDPRTRLLKRAGRGGVGDAERRADAEWRALHHRHPLRLEELGDEILVGLECLAGRRGLADRARAGRIDVESVLRPRTLQAAGLVQHRHAEFTPLLEDFSV